MAGRANGDVVVVAPEADFVAGLDAELVSQLLGYDDLALRPDTVSHTGQYNQLAAALVVVQVRRQEWIGSMSRRLGAQAVAVHLALLLLLSVNLAFAMLFTRSGVPDRPDR